MLLHVNKPRSQSKNMMWIPDIAICNMNAGLTGASRFSASTDAWTPLDRQGGQAAASTVSLDSPTSTLPAKGSLESFSKETAIAAVAQ